MKMRYIFVVWFSLLGTLWGTAQYPDRLVIADKEYDIHTNPLERYFSIYKKKRPGAVMQSSALWRGYIATYEIVEGSLRVRDIVIQTGFDQKTGFKTKSVIKDVLPGEKERSLFWYTGFIIIPQGKIVNYVHMGYASTYDGYRILYIEKGKVLADRIFTGREYEEYKKLQFEEYAKTEKYKKDAQGIHERQKGGRYMNPDNFLYIFDVSFPSDIIIDYKDFKPSSKRNVK